MNMSSSSVIVFDNTVTLPSAIRRAEGDVFLFETSTLVPPLKESPLISLNRPT